MDVDDDGVVETSDYLDDAQHGMLYTYCEDDFACPNGKAAQSVLRTVRSSPGSAPTCVKTDSESPVMNTSDHVNATSASRHTSSPSLKEKAIEEFRMFWVVAIYLAVMLTAFTWYRGLVLSESGISYFHYSAGVIEALILGKVILIGQALGLGKRFEDSRLIISVLFKALVFGIFIAIFAVLEHVIEGLVHRDTWDQITSRLLNVGRSEILARAVMMTVTLIPFFAFWETDRVMGDQKLFNLFFRKRAV